MFPVEMFNISSLQQNGNCVDHSPRVAYNQKIMNFDRLYSNIKIFTFSNNTTECLIIESTKKLKRVKVTIRILLFLAWWNLDPDVCDANLATCCEMWCAFIPSAEILIRKTWPRTLEVVFRAARPRALDAYFSSTFSSSL